MSQDNTSITVVPSVMRFERVQTILEGEPALRERLGPKDQPVYKRNQERHFFSKGVIAVTCALHQKGIDAHSADRNIVLNIASSVLDVMNDKAPALKVKPPVKRKESKPKEVKKDELKPQPKPKPKKEKAKPAPKAKPAETPKPAETTTPDAHVPAPAPAPVPAKVTTPAPAPAPVEEQAAQPQVAVYYIYAPVYALIAAAFQLLELADNSPGAEQRKGKLGSLLEDVYKLKDVAVPLPPNMLPPSLKDGQDAPSNSKG